MTGTGASHPGSCNHHKSRGAPGDTYYWKSQGQPFYQYWASISAIPFSPRPRSSKKITVWGISGWPLEHYYAQPLACSWGDFHFCHSFLFVPETPTPLLGWDLLSKFGVQLLLPPGEYFCLPLIEEQVDSTVWVDGHTMGGAQISVPVLIHLKDPSCFPHQKLYPLRSEVKEETNSYNQRLKETGTANKMLQPM
jgi:hypothetical protein